MKKLIALLLALVLVLSLVACTAKEEPEKVEEKPADSEQKPAEDKKEEDKKEEEKEAEGEEEPAARLPLSTTNEVITIGVRQNALTENYETNEYTLWLEEQTGVDLQFVYFSSDKTEANTQLSLMISGGQELPDIIWDLSGIELTQGFEYGNDGYFIPLEDYFANDTYFWAESFDDYTEAEQAAIYALGTDPTSGHLYAFPEIQKSLGGDNCQYHAYINQEWLTALNLEVPTTIDEMYEVLKAFATEDPNGNGEKDEIIAVGQEGGYRAGLLRFLMNAFVYENKEYFFNVEDGVLWVPYDTDEWREGLKWMNKLYKEGLISDQTFSIQETAEMISIVTPADEESIAGLISGHMTLVAPEENQACLDFVVQPPLADATGSGRGGYGARMDMSYFYHTYITCDAENPDLCFKFLDFMAGEESFLRMRYGTKGVHWDFLPEDTDKTSSTGLKSVFEVYDSTPYSTQGNVNWHNMGATLVNYWNHPSVFVDDGSYKSQKSLLQNSMIPIWNAAAKEEVVFNLSYSAEEAEVVNEVKEILKDFIDQCLAEFVTGVKDPNSDADWEEYLAALENQGMYRWLEAAQAAYTRMYG